MQFSIHIMIGLTLSHTNQSMHVINLAHFHSYREFTCMPRANMFLGYVEELFESFFVIIL